MAEVFFSVIIPTYNRASLLKRCLNSVINQTYSNWEAIVVDNFSTDDTIQVIEELNDSRISFIQNHNYGVISVSRNKALDVAKGDWICFLDSDDSWYPNKLECMLPYLNDFDMIYHEMKYDTPPQFFHKGRSRYYDIKESTVGYVLQRGDCISPSCTCVARQIIGETRFSEDRSFVAVEDYDFFLQIIHKNIRIKHLNKVLTLYNVTGCSQDGEGIKRELAIFTKWTPLLTEKEKHEVTLYYERRIADTLRASGNYKESLDHYKRFVHSSILMNKLLALRGMILCYFHILFR